MILTKSVYNKPLIDDDQNFPFFFDNMSQSRSSNYFKLDYARINKKREKNRENCAKNVHVSFDKAIVNCKIYNQ